MNAAVASDLDAGDLGAWRDLVHSEERRDLVDTVRRHLAARFPIDVVRDCFDTGRQPLDAWEEVVAADYPSIGLPEDLGGLGSMVDVVALLEAAGRELLPAPLLATVMSLQTSLLAGLVAQGDARRPAALAVQGDDDRLVVLDGVLAEQVTVVVPGPGGVSGVRLDPASTPPVSTHHHVDPSRPTAVFDVPGIEAEAAGSGFALGTRVDEVLAPARTALAADLTGIAAGALDRAVGHAIDREQFGKPIGAFQGVKHLLVDVYVGVERARSLTRAAAVALVDHGAGSATELSLLAKAAAADAAIEATRAQVQVLGAMGMTFEADAHLFFRRAQQTAPVLGSAASCYRRAALLRREAVR